MRSPHRIHVPQRGGAQESARARRLRRRLFTHGGQPLFRVEAERRGLEMRDVRPSPERDKPPLATNVDTAQQRDHRVEERGWDAAKKSR